MVLCGHSYGGMVISRAASGRDDVDRLVYLCAVQVADDAEMAAIMQPTPLMEHLVHGDDGSLAVDPGHAAADFYHDCAADVADASVAKLRPMPSGVDTDAMSGADVPPPAWTQMPSTYVVCTDDRAVASRYATRDGEARRRPRRRWDTSHSPMLSRPDLVADLLAALAAQ